MQSYREEAGSRPPVSQLDPLPAPVGRDDLSTYRARYEEAMNPFEAFRGRVSETTGIRILSLLRSRESGATSLFSTLSRIPEYWHLMPVIQILSRVAFSISHRCSNLLTTKSFIVGDFY